MSELLNNYGRSASDPPSTTGIWRGKVTNVSATTFDFIVPRLTGVYASYTAETTLVPAQSLEVDDDILVAFTEGRNDEFAVLGRVNGITDSVVTNIEGSLTVGGDLTVDGEIDATHINSEFDGPVVLSIKNTSGSTIAKGTPVYATGAVGASGAVEVSPSRADTAGTMPALGLTQVELAHNAEGHAVVLGVIDQVSTSAYTINDELYVAPSGGLVNTRPTGSDELVQKIGRVVRVNASTGEILVLGAGRSNDVPNSISISGDLVVETNLLYVDTSQNRIGVNTTTPSSTFQVVGTATASQLIVADSGGSTVTINTSDSVYAQVGNYSSSNDTLEIGSMGSIDFVIDTNNLTTETFNWRRGGQRGAGSVLMHLNETGKLGIGTETPVAGVDIATSGGDTWTTNGWDSGLILNAASAVRWRTASGYDWGMGNSGTKMYFMSSTSPTTGAAADYHMVIAADTGYVGINTTAASHMLEVNGNAAFNNTSQILDNWSSGSDIDALLPGSTFGGVLKTNTSGHFVIGLRNNDGADSFSIVSGGSSYTSNNTFDAMVANFRADGDVGIGTTSPNAKLHVAGDFYAPGNVVAMYSFRDTGGQRTISTNTLVINQTITTQGNTKLFFMWVSPQFIKSATTTNPYVRFMVDGSYLAFGDRSMETNHIGYGANNFREQIMSVGNTGTLSAGSHTVRVYVDSYGSASVTMNYQGSSTSGRANFLYVWEVCV